jgi:hypothetical protein
LRSSLRSPFHWGRVGFFFFFFVFGTERADEYLLPSGPYPDPPPPRLARPAERIARFGLRSLCTVEPVPAPAAPLLSSFTRSAYRSVLSVCSHDE